MPPPPFFTPGPSMIGSFVIGVLGGMVAGAQVVSAESDRSPRLALPFVSHL